MKTYKITLVMCAVLLFFGAAYGQGEQLFKAKCNTCHMVDKASIGPVLKGVKQKWNDAGEGELLYKWVENSVALINGGQSKMALAIKGFSGSEMTPQQVTPAEVDAILDYVDNYVVPPPPPPVINGVETDPNVTLVPDYEGNLTMFYWLITFLVILLFAIIIMSNTIIGFVKSDLFKNNLREQNDQKEGKNLLGIILLIVAVGSMFTSNTSYALEFVNAGDTTEKTPWLLVERSDLYILLTLDLLMVAVVLYLKNLFNTFLYMVVPRKEKVKPQRVKKIKHVLTDVVPIEDEASILMDHDYDGIQELDNNLPPWWVWGFYATILFAVIYLFNYHFFRTGDLQEAEYKKEVATAQKEIDAYLDKMAMNVDETNATLLTEEADISAGKGLFQNNCIACHKEGGQGDIGPNLTDNFWIYGKDVKVVFGTIKNGTANGMPEHASKLNPIQLQQVASFVLQLKFKAGKEPQGTEVK